MSGNNKRTRKNPTPKLEEIVTSNADCELTPSIKKARKSKEPAEKAIVACAPCKASKVKCDNSFPCKRCTRMSRQHLCVRSLPKFIGHTNIVLASEEAPLQVVPLMTYNVPKKESLLVLMSQYTEEKSPMFIYDFIINAPTVNMYDVYW
jgi:hypothetical protein